MTISPVRTASAVAVPVVVEFLPAGYRLSCPSAPGFAAVAQSRLDLARALELVRREHDVAMYAARRGQPSDLTSHDSAADAAEAAALAARRTAHRRTQSSRFDPGTWSPLPDGSWLSPQGRVYRGETRQAQQVALARQRAGLVVEWHPGLPTGRQEQVSA